MCCMVQDEALCSSIFVRVTIFYVHLSWNTLWLASCLIWAKLKLHHSITLGPSSSERTELLHTHANIFAASTSRKASHYDRHLSADAFGFEPASASVIPWYQYQLITSASFNSLCDSVPPTQGHEFIHLFSFFGGIAPDCSHSHKTCFQPCQCVLLLLNLHLSKH